MREAKNKDLSLGCFLRLNRYIPGGIITIMVKESKLLSFWTILFSAVTLSGLLWVVVIFEPILEGQCKLVSKKVKLDSQLTGLAVHILEPLPAKPAWMEK